MGRFLFHQDAAEPVPLFEREEKPATSVASLRSVSVEPANPRLRGGAAPALYGAKEGPTSGASYASCRGPNGQEGRKGVHSHGGNLGARKRTAGGELPGPARSENFIWTPIEFEAPPWAVALFFAIVFWLLFW